VADKLIRLKQALAEETQRREAVEQQVAQNAERRKNWSGPGEIQHVQEAFQTELESADNPRPLLELESSLTSSQQARAELESELEEARRELQTLRQSQPRRSPNSRRGQGIAGQPG